MANNASDDESETHVQTRFDTLSEGVDDETDSGTEESPSQPTLVESTTDPPEDGLKADSVDEGAVDEDDDQGSDPTTEQTAVHSDEEVVTEELPYPLPQVKWGVETVTAKTASILGTAFYSIALWLSRTVRNDGDKKKGLSGYFYPDDKIDEDETELFAATPSRWRAFGPYTLATMFFLTAALTPVVITTGMYEAYFQARSPSFIIISAPQYWWIFSIICIILGIITIIGEIIHRAATWLVLTDSTIYLRQNPIEQSNKLVRLDEIAHAKDKTPFPGRLVNIGEISIATAGSDGAEIIFRNMKDASERATMISKQQAKRDGDTDEEVIPESEAGLTEA